MKAENKYQCLADEIRVILKKGLNTGPDILDFIDSVFSSPTSSELMEILNHDDGAEASPLIELIFFPDKLIQMRLEKLLENGCFCAGDEDKIMSCLFRHDSPKTVMTMRDGEKFVFAVPYWAASQFVSRLRISRCSDQRLIESIHNHVDESNRIMFKVGLRNSEFVQTEKKVRFLCNFLKRVTTSPDEFAVLFDFILIFLDEIGDRDDMFKALTDKKKHYLRSIREAEKFAKQLKRDNIETLLLRGVRAPHADPSDALKKMEFIDHINYAVFGRR